MWGLNASAPRPDLLVLQMPLHTCVHGLDPHREGHHNASLIAQHEQDTAQLMRAVKGAVDRQPRKTAVIVMTGGRNFIKGPSKIINCKNNMEEIFLSYVHRLNYLIGIMYYLIFDLLPIDLFIYLPIYLPIYLVVFICIVFYLLLVSC